MYTLLFEQSGIYYPGDVTFRRFPLWQRRDLIYPTLR